MKKKLRPILKVGGDPTKAISDGTRVAPKVLPLTEEQIRKNLEMNRKQKLRDTVSTLPSSQTSISSYIPQAGEQKRMNAMQQAVRIGRHNPIHNFVEGEHTQKAIDNVVLPMLDIQMGMAAGKLARPALEAAGRYLTEETFLKNAHKINPYSFKPNPEAYYRGIGKSGLDDAIQSGVLKTPKGSNFGDELYLSNKFSEAEYYADNKLPWAISNDGTVIDDLVNGKGINTDKYIAEIPKTKVNARPYHISDSQFVTNDKISINDVKLLKEHWLKGYQEVPKSKDVWWDGSKYVNRPTNTLSEPEITRGPIDWAGGVNRENNPFFSARGYENQYDNIGYHSPAEGTLAPRIKGSHPNARIDDMLKKLPQQDSFNYVNYGEKGIPGQGYAVDPNFLQEDKIDAGKMVSKWFKENKVDRAHRVGLFLDLPKNALGGETGKKNPYTKRDLYNYLFPKDEEETKVVLPTAPSQEEIIEDKQEVDDGSLEMAMSMGLNPYQNNTRTVSEQADDVNPYAQETKNDILSNMKGVRDLGIWGDESHQRRKSDHNTGDAWDAGIDAPEVGETLVNKLQKEAKERNIKYIIYNGKIWNPSVSGDWRPYTGPDKHTDHAHISYNR